LVKLLQEFIAQLEKESVPVQFEYEDENYIGEAMPISQTCIDDVCSEFDITLNDKHFGIIKRMKNNWKIDGVKDQIMVDRIGDEITKWYGS
jgi:hypothetical protein